MVEPALDIPEGADVRETANSRQYERIFASTASVDSYYGLDSTIDSDLRPPLIADPILAGMALALVVLSLVMIYSTTGVADMEKYGDALFHLKRQGVAAIIGVVGMLLASRLSLPLLRRLAMPIYLVAALLLVMTLLPGIGDAAGGARRWVNLGIVRFQPGEFAKLAFVLALSAFVARRENAMKAFGNGILKPVTLATIFALPLLMQPDFGSTVVIFGIALGLGLVCGARLRHLALCGVGCAVAGGLLIITSSYRMKRVLSFLNAEADPSGDSYQLRQSLIAVGNGGLFGVGIGNSQQKLHFLPAAHTDFIFAVIGEEVGLVGCLLVISLFVVMLARGIYLASTLSRDTFPFALAVGLTLYLVFPAFVNMGVVLGLLPTKGIALPLVSYGGTSLVASLVAVGVLLAVARTRHQNALADG